MAELPYMPFYVGDYLQDTRHLSTEEHGAYFLLILTYWNNGGALKDDNRILARITGLSTHKWKAVRPSLEPFFTCDGVTWMHKRIELDLLKARGKVEKAKAAGRASARKRRNFSGGFSKKVGKNEAELSTEKSNENSKGGSTDAQRPLRSSTNQSYSKNNPLTPLPKRSPSPSSSDTGSCDGRSDDGEAQSIGQVLSSSGFSGKGRTGRQKGSKQS